MKTLTRSDLRVRNLGAGYESAQVLHGINLEVLQGEVVAVIGPNGAGKTTLLRAITGILPVDFGGVEYGGVKITSLPIPDIARMGIAHVMEGRGILPNLSIGDNLRLSGFMRPSGGQRFDDLSFAFDLFPWLETRLHDRAGDLSGGQQQMVAIARAALARPRLFLLDEPSQGLAPKVVTEIFESVMTLAATGTSVLVVEQHVQRVLDLCDRAYVIQRGRIVLEGTPAFLREGDRLEEAYFS